MDKKKRAGIAAAALLTVGAFGAMAYGAESERVTIGMDASLESTETEQERVTFHAAADGTAETEAVEEETTEAVAEETPAAG
ncbi:MAG: hypothetical protein Q4B01_00385, partial [Eubacteriales bacterium]|nr:hypothetical protein [Eubacteriales bacterium]